MVPQVARLIIQSDYGPGGDGRLVVNAAALEGIFGEKSQHLMEILNRDVKTVPPSEHAEEESRYLSGVRTLAGRLACIESGGSTACMRPTWATN